MDLGYLTEGVVWSDTGCCGGHKQGCTFQRRVSISERTLWKCHALFLPIFTTPNSPPFQTSAIHAHYCQRPWYHMGIQGPSFIWRWLLKVCFMQTCLIFYGAFLGVNLKFGERYYHVLRHIYTASVLRIELQRQFLQKKSSYLSLSCNQWSEGYHASVF
jgi:hypothetical protein